MLILTRKAGEAITLDVSKGGVERKVVVKVLEIKGSIVRLGVEADSTIVVERTPDADDARRQST